jgi:hypothetical protein
MNGDVVNAGCEMPSGINHIIIIKNEQDQSCSQITSEMRHFPSKNMKLPYRQCLNHQHHGIIPVYTIIPYFMV